MTWITAVAATLWTLATVLWAITSFLQPTGIHFLLFGMNALAAILYWIRAWAELS